MNVVRIQVLAVLGLAVMIAFDRPTCAQAQTQPVQADDAATEIQSQNEGLRDLGNTAETGNGQVGQRQTQDNAVPNVKPTARLDNRIANRIQNRIRNRIGQNYDPEADAVSPFQSADKVSRDPNQPQR